MTAPQPPREDEPEAAAPSPLGGLQRIKALVRPIMGVVAAVFVVAAGRELYLRWVPGQVEVDYVMVACSVPPLIIGVLVLALGWTWLLEQLSGNQVPVLPAMALHVESQAARYTPGKVGVPLVRMMGAAQLGTTSRIVASSIFVEILCFVAVGGALGFTLLFVLGDMAKGASDALGSWGLPVLGCFVVGLVGLLIIDRQLLPAKVRGLLHLEGKGPLVPWKLPLIHAVYWLTWALHGYFTSRAIQAPHQVAISAAGLYVLAPIMGFLAMATPGGLGVREAVLSIALSTAVGPAAALYAALLSRGTSVIVDVGMWLGLRPYRAGPREK